MDERKYLLQVFDGELPAKKPWYADLSYLYNSLVLKGELEKKYEGEEGYLRFHIDMGAGIYISAPLLVKKTFTNGVQYFEKEENGTMTCVYQTPLGTIRSVQKYLPVTYTWAFTEHFVKSIEDLRIMLYVCENTRYEESYDDFVRIERMWGDNGLATGLSPDSVAPLQKLIARWAGVEKTVDLLIDEPDEFDEITARMGEAEDSLFDILAASPAEYIEFTENLSSEITGKTFFEQYNFDYYSKRVDQLHKAGKYAGIHIDGTLTSCLPLLQKCGFDVAEAVTPAPCGDVEVENLRACAGSDIIIWGGIPGVLFSGLYSDDFFDEYVNRVLTVFQNDPKFVLGVADQVPPDGLISRVKRVAEICKEHISGGNE